MFELLVLLVVSFFTGVSVKIVDMIEDDGLKLFFYANHFFAFVYGLLIGYVIINYDIVNALWIGTIAAMMVTKKIDKFSHFIGILVAGFVVLVYGLSSLNLTFFGIFLIAAMVDEISSDYIDRLKKKKKKIKGILKVFEFRPVLEVTALIVSVIISDFTPFIAIIVFDSGYLFIERFYKKSNSFKK